MVRHRDVVLAHLIELGLRLNVRKVCFFSTENHLSGHGGNPSKRRLVTHCQKFRKLLGMISAASNVIPFGLLYMRPLQWWRKTKGFSPRGKSTSYDQGYAAMPTCLRDVEETLGFCLKAWC